MSNVNHIHYYYLKTTTLNQTNYKKVKESKIEKIGVLIGNGASLVKIDKVDKIDNDPAQYLDAKWTFKADKYIILIAIYQQ